MAGPASVRSRVRRPGSPWPVPVEERPGSEPSPGAAHLEMLGAVLEGGGLERVAEIASARAGAPVVVIVPGEPGTPAAWRPYERYVEGRLRGHGPSARPDVALEVPVVSDGEQLGSVLMLGEGYPGAAPYLRAAALAALTQVAVSRARDQAEEDLRRSLLEALRRGGDLDHDEIVRRARRLGCDLGGGAVAVCADPGGRPAGQLLATIATESPAALAEAIDGRVYALVPGDPEDARRLARRLGRGALVGFSSHHVEAADLGRAVAEAELVLEVTARGGAPPAEDLGDGLYRLLFRAFASHPEEVRSYYEDTLAPVVRYDEQYRTELVETLAAYLRQDGNMSATAKAIHAHRHTVGYRLERVRELTGLDPLSWDDRERLALGLKAHRIVAPHLPR